MTIAYSMVMVMHGHASAAGAKDGRMCAKIAIGSILSSHWQLLLRFTDFPFPLFPSEFHFPPDHIISHHYY